MASSNVIAYISKTCFVLPISCYVSFVCNGQQQCPIPNLHSDGLGEITLTPIILHCLLTGQRNTPPLSPQHLRSLHSESHTPALFPIRAEKYPFPLFTIPSVTSVPQAPPLTPLHFLLFCQRNTPPLSQSSASPQHLRPLHSRPCT